MTHADFEAERLTDPRACQPVSRAVEQETFSQDAVISMPRRGPRDAHETLLGATGRLRGVVARARG